MKVHIKGQSADVLEKNNLTEEKIMWKIKINRTDPLPTPSEDGQWIIMVELENDKEVVNTYRSGSADYWYNFKGLGRSTSGKGEGWNPVVGWAWIKK